MAGFQVSINGRFCLSTEAWAAQWALGLNRHDKWVTTRDVDLASSWFFTDPQDGSPLKGTLAAGSAFTVTFVKGSAVYVEMDHVFDRRAMATFAKPADQVSSR
jgi:hypothetical protein